MAWIGRMFRLWRKRVAAVAEVKDALEVGRLALGLYGLVGLVTGPVAGALSVLFTEDFDIWVRALVAFATTVIAFFLSVFVARSIFPHRPQVVSVRDAATTTANHLDDGGDAENNQGAASANRNGELIRVATEFANQTGKMLTSNQSDDIKRAWQAARMALESKRRVATGEDSIIVGQFMQSVFEVRSRWVRYGETSRTRRGALGELRRLTADMAGKLERSALSKTHHDRTHWLSRIRALLRAQRDEGMRLITLSDPWVSGGTPDDLYSQLEAWARRTSDLLVDAYGGDIRVDFRNELWSGGSGYQAFRTAIGWLGDLIARADQMHLVDTFRFEDWEPTPK